MAVLSETQAEIDRRAAALARIANPTPKPLSAEEWMERVSSAEDVNEAVKAAWQCSPALREEFGTPGALLAFVQADRRGQIGKTGTRSGVADEFLQTGIATPERARECWENSDALRAEFATPEILWAYCKNARAGCIRLSK